MLANDGGSKGSKATKSSKVEEEKKEDFMVKKEEKKAVNSDKMVKVMATSASSSSSSMPDVLPQTKLPPPAVLNLTNESAFISVSTEDEERDRLRRAQMLKSLSQNAAFEAANRPPQVIIPDDLLVKLYALLGKKAPPPTPPSSSTAVIDASKEEIHQSVTEKKSSYTNPMSCYGVSDALFLSLSSSFSSSSSYSFPSFPGFMAVLFSLRHTTLPLSHGSPPSPPLLATSYTLEILEEEMESLAAIYPTEFSFSKTVSELDVNVSVLLSVQLQSFKNANLRLEVYILMSSLTQTSTTVVPFLSSANTAPLAHPERLLSLQHMLWAHAVTLTQAPIVFDLLMWLESQADSMMRESTSKSSEENIYLLRLTETPVNMSSAVGGNNTMDDDDDNLQDDDIMPEELSGDDDVVLSTSNELKTKVAPSPSSSSSTSFWRRSKASTIVFQLKKSLGNTKLPAFLSKQTFLDMIASSPAAVIVTGETGSGM